MACVICPTGCGTVWIADDDGTNFTSWTRLVHVDSWTITPNLQEATKKRTSDTGGAASKFCADILDWTAEITNTLCIDDWLYADILTNPTNPSVGVSAWFFLGWGCEHAPQPQGTGVTTPITGDVPDAGVGLISAVTGGTLSDSGVYLYGTVNPPGFGIVNDGSDPATADWTIAVSVGPILPAASGATYSGSDGDPTNAT